MKTISVLVLALGLSACDTKQKIDTALDKAAKVMDQVGKLTASITDALNSGKAAASSAFSNLAPNQQARVPALPAKVTGMTNVAAMKSGVQGTVMKDLGDGPTQTATVMADDDQSAFVAWQGAPDKADDFADEGLCYLSWQNQGEWLVISFCDAADGAWVCQLGDGSQTCQACNVEGNCVACANDGSDCMWPAPSGA